MSQEESYWSSLPYSDFLLQWNSDRPPSRTNPSDTVLQTGLPLVGVIALADSPFPGPADVAALFAGLCLAGMAAMAAGDAVALPIRPVVNYSGTTFPLVLAATPNFDWQKMEIEAVIAISGILASSQIKILYRGKTLGNLLNPTEPQHEGRLWLAKNVKAAVEYAIADVNFQFKRTQPEHKIPAIGIYGILQANFDLLWANRNIIPRLNTDLGFDNIAQTALVGPVIVPIPFEFTG